MLGKAIAIIARYSDSTDELITGVTVFSSVLEIMHVAPYGVIGLVVGIVAGVIRALFITGE